MPTPGAELIPGPILDSPLMQQGGYEVFGAFPDRRTLTRMRAEALRLLPGQTMLLWGGFLAHSVSPVSGGQTRIVSSLCYRLDLRQRKGAATTRRRP